MKRVAALLPAATEIVHALGAFDEIAGVTLAGRLSPAPDVLTLDARTLEGIFSDILHIADALCRRDNGTALVAALRERLLRVHDTLKSAGAPRPRVAVIEWTSPLFAAGHWVPDMIHRAGGRDVLGTSGAHSRALNVAEVAETVPDVVIVAPCGFTLSRAAEEGSTLLAREDWAWASRCDVWAVDGNAFVSRPGPRVVDGVEVFASILHPSLFAAPAARAALRLVSARAG